MFEACVAQYGDNAAIVTAEPSSTTTYAQLDRRYGDRAKVLVVGGMYNSTNAGNMKHGRCCNNRESPS